MSLQWTVRTWTLETYDPGVDSASNRNEYQEPSLGVKGKADNLTTIYEPIV
jgi:hypothetical protein